MADDMRRYPGGGVSLESRPLDIVRVAIFSHDFHGVISLWDRVAERLYGWSQEGIAARSIHELLQTRFPVSREDALTTVQSTGEWRGQLIQISPATATRFVSKAVGVSNSIRAEKVWAYCKSIATLGS